MGRRPVTITRMDLDAAGLRRAAGRCGDGRASCRMLSLAPLLEGTPREAAARAGGMDWQSLRDWVHRYNARGVEGLSDAPRPGRPRVLSAAQLEEVRDLVVAGPDPGRDGVVRWRCLDLRRRVEERHGVRGHERTIGKRLHRLGMTRLRPRPFHPKSDAPAQEAFKKTSPSA
jgi:transposase